MKINLRHDENINHILTFCNTSQGGKTPVKMLFAYAISIPYPLLQDSRGILQDSRGMYGSYEETRERNYLKLHGVKTTQGVLQSSVL